MRSHTGAAESWARRVLPRAGAATHWLVLAGSLALTVAATLFVAITARSRDEARFENAVQSATDRIVGRLDIYISTLRGAAALFAVGDVTVDDFQRYVERLELQRWHPGIQGIGWSPRIATGLSGDVDEQYEILYLEPQDARNRAAMGYDMYSEERRREAMRRARDLGEPALSGRVTLRQEIDGLAQPGFLLYVPVYSGGGKPATVEERRAALLGFAYAPFRAHDLFTGIFGTEAAPRVRFAVYDGADVAPESLLVMTEREPERRGRHRRSTSRLLLAGRTWTVAYEAQPEFEAASTTRIVPLVLLAGLLASVWLFALARGQTRARAAAEQANRAKSAFLATMSHELRTPLNAIGGYVDLMQLGVPGPTTAIQRQYLTRVQRAQQHLLTLINDVLDFARIDAGRVEYRLHDVLVGEAVADALSLVDVQAREKRLQLNPRGRADVQALADPERLRQILVNLLSNAVKFTDADGRIDVEWLAVENAVEVRVSDTGIGIPQECLESVFEPFLQLDGDFTRRRSGAGLGLAISRDLARGMGGEITASSGVAIGSTFVLSLPKGGLLQQFPHADAAAS
jgi:signal transduction histidine kinase